MAMRIKLRNAWTLVGRALLTLGQIVIAAAATVLCCAGLVLLAVLKGVL